MSQTNYRANLAAKDMTFLAEAWGRTVILKQFDQNFSRQIVSPTDPDKDIGIPQIFYCHNVMPAAGGFQSVGITQTVPPLPGGKTGMTQQFSYSDATVGLVSYIGFVPVGNTYDVYRLIRATLTWAFIMNVPASDTVNFRVSSATVNGILYVYIPFNNCYIFNGTTLTVQALGGLTPAAVVGITESYGYMIAWNFTTIAWSSTIDPTDFVPSLITGAGSGSVQQLKGKIQTCYHHTYGFIIYSTSNAVSAVYSGNPQFPFNYREIINGGGIQDPELITTDPETGNQFAWTTAGLQLMSITSAAPVSNNQFPELVNFIGGSRFEDFNEVTNTLIEIDIALGSMVKRLNVIAARYLVVSYGVTSLTHALVYDSAMRRWGKIKANHVDVFDYYFSNPNTTARASFGLLAADGSMSIVDFSYKTTGNGVMMLGKYQHSRARMITLLGVQPENIFDTSACTVGLLTTYDGKTFQPIKILTPAADSSPLSPQYPTKTTGLNHSLLFKGAFNLDCLILSYIENGVR